MPEQSKPRTIFLILSVLFLLGLSAAFAISRIYLGGGHGGLAWAAGGIGLLALGPLFILPRGVAVGLLPGFVCVAVLMVW